MDDHDFDAWTRSLTNRLPRRGFWRGLVGGALAVPLAQFGRAPAAGAQEAAAARCLREGKACKGDRQCCSGVCKKGPRGRTCRPAPGQGSCTIRKDVCRAVDPLKSVCAADGSDACACQVRINGAAFCADCCAGGCFRCRRDAECAAEFGAGFVCVRAGRFCDCAEQGGTLCVARCPNPA